MLKKRVAATLIVREGKVVQSLNFQRYLPVGSPAIAIEYLNAWGIDEIILLDITAGKNRTEPDYTMIKEASKKCYVPLTVGGGITNTDQITRLMHAGADKISLNYAARKTPELISEAAHIFGDQCVVVSIDAVATDEGYRVYDYQSKKITSQTPAQLAIESTKRGTGEILINSVDRDGSYIGYDLELINSICDCVTVPVICCGGAKNAFDIIKVLQTTNVSAASAGNFYHFTEHSVNLTKAIVNREVPIRLETHANYGDVVIDNECRLVKKSDNELEEMLFVRIENEII